MYSVARCSFRFHALASDLTDRWRLRAVRYHGPTRRRPVFVGLSSCGVFRTCRIDTQNNTCNILVQQHMHRMLRACRCRYGIRVHGRTPAGLASPERGASARRCWQPTTATARTARRTRNTWCRHLNGASPRCNMQIGQDMWNLC